MNKIEKIGIGNLMGTPSALSLSAGMYARPALTSPMAQLTCLLPSHSQSIENLTSVKQHSEQKKVSEEKPPGKKYRFSIYLAFMQKTLYIIKINVILLQLHLHNLIYIFF